MCNNIMQFPSNYVMCRLLVTQHYSDKKLLFTFFWLPYSGLKKCVLQQMWKTSPCDITWDTYTYTRFGLSQVCIQPHFVFVSLQTYRRSNAEHQF